MKKFKIELMKNLKNNLIANLKDFFLNQFSPEIKKSDIKNKNLSKIFKKFGFIIVRNFFETKRIKSIKKRIDNNLKIKKNLLTKTYLTDALNYDNSFLDLIIDKDIHYINGLLLGNDYSFLQTFDLHANTHANNWHRDISSKSGGCIELKNKFAEIIKYALFFEISNSAFCVVPGSHESNKKNNIFGKDMYDLKENFFYSNECKKDEIIFVLPNPGDLIVFDLRLLHCAIKLDKESKPSRKAVDKEKKVMWPSFARKSVVGENIYQYYRFLRKDFGHRRFNKSIENNLKKRDLLPKTYEKLSYKHLKWLKNNIMYPEQFDSIMFLNDDHNLVRSYREEYYKKNINGKNSNLAKLNKILLKN